MNTVGDSFRGTVNDLRIADSATRAPQPDDLDLSAMARAALNYLRGNPDPARHYECKFTLGPLGIPCHYPEWVRSNEYGYDPISIGDTDCRMDWQYQHMREMAGEPEADDVERGVRRRVLSYLDDQGYAWINPAAYVGRPVEGRWIGTWTTAKIMVSLAEEYRRTGDKAARRRAKTILGALRKLALWDGPRAYYWGIAPFKDGKWLLDGWCQYHARNYPFIVEACVRYSECTGDDEGIALATAFADGFLAGSQPDMGTQRIDPQTGAFTGHVHLHTHAIYGVAHLGVLLDRPEYLDWVRQAYAFVLANGTDYGWYPEHTPQQHYVTEICVVGDMVSNGVWLARGGQPEYWDHIERTVRNELRRSQFFLTPAFLHLFRRLHHGKPATVLNAALDELRRLEGGFVAQSSFSDWVGYPSEKMGQAGITVNGIQMMGCCPPEGMRALWEAWCWTVQDAADGVYVNLAFTRDHPAASVTAFRPVDGRLEVKAKKAGTYFLRPPAWVDRNAVRLWRLDRKASVHWGGPADAYVCCRRVRPGHVLALTWPAPCFRQTHKALSIPNRDTTLTVTWCGNEVTGVEPAAQYLPLFGG